VIYVKYIFLISRTASYTIDYMLFYILLYFTGKYSTLGYVISLVIFFLYRYLLTAYFGSTIGMKILKLKLKNYDKKICLKREIYRFASAFFFIGYIYALFDPKSRTFHDIAADTYVYYGANKEAEEVTRPWYIRAIASILLVLSVIRWSSEFMLNEVGLMGFKKVYVSDEYLQSFEGDNLVSLSQDELYKKTLGRKYSTVVDINKNPQIIRISNKLTYTEVYKLNINGKKMIGEYMYKIDVPLQFICSGKFDTTNDLCGVSPQNKIVIVRQDGKIYGENQIKVFNVITLRCGDIDGDGRDEAVVLGRGGDVEIFKFQNNKLDKIYSGKIGEDIVPQTFYIDNGISVITRSDETSMIYFYSFKENKFTFEDKKYFNVKDVGNAAKLNDTILISNVSMNSMSLGAGKTQRFEIYSIKDKIKKRNNLGTRPSRRYAYMVRTLEGVYDIDKDGTEEVIIKAVGKKDPNGQGYIIEVYKPRKAILWVNRVLTKTEDILTIGN
jgi:uncharacterized RDD family membrane protein YckC